MKRKDSQMQSTTLHLPHCLDFVSIPDDLFGSLLSQKNIDIFSSALAAGDKGISQNMERGLLARGVYVCVKGNR